MKRINLYVHYDSVTNYMMTRAMNLTSDDFNSQNMPHNLILAESPADFGRYDVQTNFKILRGRSEVLHYMESVHQAKLRMSNWIDFETMELMHQLSPQEIAELLYLFHSSNVLRSAFFYKLQNNFVYLTLSNGLNKMFYRHIQDFYPRFSRVMTEYMKALANENKSMFFAKREQIELMPTHIVEELAPLFINGIKIDFVQAKQVNGKWLIPLFIIEDELTLLTQNQSLTEQVGEIVYDLANAQWRLVLNI